MNKVFKLATLLIITGLCFALDAGLGMFSGSIMLGFLGVAGELTEDQKREKEDFLKSVGEGVSIGLKPIMQELKEVMGKVKAEPVGKDLRKELRATNPEYRLSCFITALKKNDEATIKEILAEEKAITTANNETTTTAGGYLVPAITEAKINELIPTYSQALKVCSVMPMTSGNVINIPKLTTGCSGNWVDEQAAITPENFVLGVDTLTPKKWAGNIPLSNELLEDSNPAIGAFLIKHLAIASGVALDTKVFQNGNTTLTGLFYASNSFGSTVTTSGTNPNTVIYDDFVNATLGVDMNYNNNPVWLMSRSVLGIALTLKDALSGRPLFDYNTKTLLDYPVVIVEKAPTSADVASKPIVLFGDFTNSTVGDVLGTRILIANEGSVTINGSYVSLLENDLSAVRAIKRWAFAPGLTGAYSVIKTHA